MREQWQRDLEKFSHDFMNVDLLPAYRAVDKAVSTGFAQNFAAKVDEFGIAWKPHAPATIAMYGVHDLLILSGAMYAAATVQTNPGHVFRVDGNEVVIGVDGRVIPYAIVHHHGGGRVPRRRVIYVNSETLKSAFVAFRSVVEKLISAP